MKRGGTMKKGFTLLEILLTISILSILVTIYVSYHKDTLQQTKNNVSKVQTVSLQNAISQYVQDTGVLPEKSIIDPFTISLSFKDGMKSISSQIPYMKDVSDLFPFLRSIDEKKLQPYLRTNSTISQFYMVSISSPFLPGYILSEDGSIQEKPNSSLMEPVSIKQLARGYDHLFILLNNGTLLGVGRNAEGQLGNGTTDNISKISFLQTDIDAIYPAGHHTFAKKKDGTWLTWGRNVNGELGVGTFENQLTPKTLTLPAAESDIKDIKTGGNHTLILLKDGRVLSFGFNDYGQLGLGHTNKTMAPAFVQESPGVTLQNIKRIEIGNFSSFAQKKDGTWISWGYNLSGQIGDKTTSNRYFPVTMSVLTPYFDQIKSISTSDHTLVLLENGTVLSFGRNVNGQLGLGDNTAHLDPQLVKTKNGPLTNISFVSTGSFSSLAVDSSGNAYTWGDNSLGQLCDGSNTSSNLALPLSLNGSSFMLRGNYISWQKNNTVYSCGFNKYSNIGDGTTKDTPIPFATFSL